MQGTVRPPRTVTCVEITPGPVAPWRQLHALLLAQIDSGELAPGDRIPSIRDLSQQYGVALTTVQKALDALKADGKVVTSPMGTFVSGQG
jgi:GntR family transcriptional regulator